MCTVADRIPAQAHVQALPARMRTAQGHITTQMDKYRHPQQWGSTDGTGGTEGIDNTASTDSIDGPDSTDSDYSTGSIDSTAP